MKAVIGSKVWSTCRGSSKSRFGRAVAADNATLSSWLGGYRENDVGKRWIHSRGLKAPNAVTATKLSASCGFLAYGSRLPAWPCSASPSFSSFITSFSSHSLQTEKCQIPRRRSSRFVVPAFQARTLSSSSKPPTSPDSRPPSISPATSITSTPLPRLSEDIYTIPNALTILRLFATPVLGYMIIYPAEAYPYAAAGLFAISGFTDWLDGYLARKWNQQTVFGSIVDPLADKALVTTVVVSLAIKGTLYPPLALLILGRDVSLATAALYYRYASLPKPKTMKRYWNPSLPSAVVHPTGVSKINTFLQLSYVMLLMVEPLVSGSGGMGGIMTIPPVVMTSAQVIVATTTIGTWAEYVVKPDAVTILGSGSEAEKRKVGVRGRAVIGTGLVICVLVWIWMATTDSRPCEENEGDESTGDDGVRK